MSRELTCELCEERPATEKILDEYERKNGALYFVPVHVCIPCWYERCLSGTCGQTARDVRLRGRTRSWYQGRWHFE